MAEKTEASAAAVAEKKLKKKTQPKKKVQNKILERTQKEIEALRKKFKIEISTFTEDSLAKIEFVDSGIPEINEMITGNIETGGYPRSRMSEISGPEGSGKTFLLTKLYARCQEIGLKCMHYDAEGSYAMDFAKVHGLNPDALVYSKEDKCEKVMGELEELLENDVFDVIGIDSLASLVPNKTNDSEMGKQNYGPLANAMANCYPRVNSALKKSKTVLIFINQLRDNIAAAGKPWLDPEKTPGGRTTKFFASVRITARPRKPLKTDRPEMFHGGRRIGHILNMKTIKNKVWEPFHESVADLMYRRPGKVVQVVEEAIENDIIIRQRKKKDNSLYGRELKYKDMSFVPEVKYDPYSTSAWLTENNLILPLLVEMGYDDFDEFVELGDITEEQVEEYLVENSVKE